MLDANEHFGSSTAYNKVAYIYSAIQKKYILDICMLSLH